MNKLVVTILLFLGVFLPAGQSQTLSAWIKAADESFIKEDYYAAFKYFGIALEYDTARLDVWYKYGESARHFDAYVIADSAYQKVLDKKPERNYPELKYWLAFCKQKLSQYDNAKDLYSQFLEEQPKADKELRKAAEKSIEDCDWAIEVIAERDDSLLIRHLGDKINSPYSDFGSTLHGDTLYYSSLKFLFKKDTIDPPRTHIKILSSVDGEKGITLPEDINEPNRHVAHTAFNTNNSKVYYTICDYVQGTVKINCDLYSRDRDETGVWSNPIRLSINEKEVTNTQPNVGFDSDTGIEYLYFVSDRKGGKGGLDIYRSEIDEKGNLSKPENMEAINTEGDDVTPFFHTLKQTLYFSSDGYRTLGGFDIYRSEKLGKGWSVPDHMGVPLNTSYNDMYYGLFAYGSKIYLSSNRPDSAAIFWDKEKNSCCNDIYAINEEVTLDLLALTYNLLDSLALENATVNLYEITPEGEKLIGNITNPEGNDFHFPLLPGKKYRLEALRDSFSVAHANIDLTPQQPEVPTTLMQKLYLEPGLYLDVFTLTELDSAILAGGSVLLYDITTGEEVLLDSLFNLDGNEFGFPIERGHKYVIKGFHEDFYPVTDTLDLSGSDVPEVGRIKRWLYFGQPETLALEVLTFKQMDSLALVGSSVALYNITTGEEVLLDSIANLTGNDFQFPLIPGNMYVIKGFREGFYPVTDTLDLTGPEAPKTGYIVQRLYLGQATPLYLEALTYKRLDSMALVGSSVALYNITTGEKILIDSLENINGNEFHFPLIAGQLYILEGFREGFYPITDTLNLTGPESPKSGYIIHPLYLTPPSPIIETLTSRSLDSLALDGTSIAIYDVTGPMEILLDTLPYLKGNTFVMDRLDPLRKYLVIAYRDDLITDRVPLSFTEKEGFPLDTLVEINFDPPILLDVRTFRRDNVEPLYGSTVFLYDITDGIPRLVDSLVNKEGNDFIFELTPGHKYVIEGQHEGFVPVKDTLDLTGPLPDTAEPLRRDLYFDRPPTEAALEAFTFDASDKTPLEGVTIKLLKMIDGKLDTINITTNGYANDFLFPIDPAGGKYIIIAEKPGFEVLVDTINVTPQELIANNGKITVELYLERISFDDFLPLALYFDNDRPDRRTYNRTTKQAYIPTNQAYYAKKQEFIDEFTQGLSENDKFLTARRFEDFFEREVNGGRQDLESFTAKLHTYLQRGNALTIKLKGFASPRGASKYNENLSSRRIDSVKNHFKRYKNGVLVPYIKSGKLAVVEETYGESTADGSISDSFDDPKNSVFSIIASVERRVEIIDVAGEE